MRGKRKKKKRKREKFFFFKQKTAYEIYQCDWSSDVCSSDLIMNRTPGLPPTGCQHRPVNMSAVHPPTAELRQ